MKVRKFFLRLLSLPGINRFVDKRWLSMMYMDQKDIMALRLKAYNEIQAMIALHGKGEELLANTLAEHKVQSEPCRAGGVTWSCSCGARGYSPDRRGHWAELLIREMNAIRDMKYTPESWRERLEAIFMAIDEALARTQQ